MIASILRRLLRYLYVSEDWTMLELDLRSLPPPSAPASEVLEVVMIKGENVNKFKADLIGRNDSGLRCNVGSNTLLFAGYSREDLFGVVRFRIGGSFYSKRFRRTVELGCNEVVQDWIYVVANVRGTGVARLLQERAMHMISEIGYEKAIAWVSNDNIPSLRLHERTGFRILESITRQRVLNVFQRNKRLIVDNDKALRIMI